MGMSQVCISLLCPNNFGWFRVYVERKPENSDFLKCFDSDVLAHIKWYEIMRKVTAEIFFFFFFFLICINIKIKIGCVGTLTFLYC